MGLTDCEAFLQQLFLVHEEGVTEEKVETKGLDISSKPFFKPSSLRLRSSSLLIANVDSCSTDISATLTAKKSNLIS